MNTRLTCFFCGLPIEGKSTDEHIFSDTLLGNNGLKNMKIILTDRKTRKTYSRAKVKAHGTCNNENGGAFEDLNLKILDNLEPNREILRRLHSSDQAKIGSIESAVADHFKMWLAKIFFGLIYWESHIYEGLDNREQLLESLKDESFQRLRDSFTKNNRFNVPSSIFYFEIYHSPGTDPDLNFDFATNIQAKSVFVRIKGHLFVCCLGDDRLVEEWFTHAHWVHWQKQVLEQKLETDYLEIFAEISAVRLSLPVAPRLDYLDNGDVVGKSRLGFKDKPAIDENAIERARRDILSDLSKRND